MDLAPEQLQFLGMSEIVKESISIPKKSPKTFYLITLTLIFPLSFAILAHSLFTHPILSQLEAHPDGTGAGDSKTAHEWTVLLIFQFCYLIFLFAFSLLSTAAVVFTVASLYTAKAVSFSSTLAAIPKVFKRLFITFLWVALLMVLYYALLICFLVLVVVAVDVQNPILLLGSSVCIILLFGGVLVYITGLWHLASVVSVLEHIYGFAAMKKSYELLQGRVKMAYLMVFVYLVTCAVIGGVFGSVVVHGGEGYGARWRRAASERLPISGASYCRLIWGNANFPLTILNTSI